jgi:hypothetical protein
MASGNQVGPRRQADFPPEEFIARRERICDAIGEAHALLQGAPRGPAGSLERLRHSSRVV